MILTRARYICAHRRWLRSAAWIMVFIASETVLAAKARGSDYLGEKTRQKHNIYFHVIFKSSLVASPGVAPG